MSSIGGGTTVVDGHLSTTASGNGKAPRFEESFKPSASKASAANFVSALDYMEEDRQFFVKIEKDGLIAALQKLDRQLKNVRTVACSVPCSGRSLTFPYSTGRPRTHPVAQGIIIRLRAQSQGSSALTSGTVATDGLDWKGSYPWTNRPHQPRWSPQGPDAPRTVPWHAPPELVGTQVGRDTRTCVSGCA